MAFTIMKIKWSSHIFQLNDETAHSGEDPPLGILINMLKTTCANFGLAVQEQVSIAHKLANITEKSMESQTSKLNGNLDYR